MSETQKPIRHTRNHRWRLFGIGVPGMIDGSEIEVWRPKASLFRRFTDRTVSRKAGLAVVVGALVWGNSCLAALGDVAGQNTRAAAMPVTMAARLDSTNAAVRFYAERDLGKLNEPAGIEPLIRALHDPDACIRIAAAGALGNSTEPAAKSALIEVLTTEEDAEIWDMAAKPFLAKGPDAIPVFLEVFWKAKSLEIRSYAGLRLTSELGWKPTTEEEKTAYFISTDVVDWPSLVDLGPAKIPALLEVLAYRNSWYRRAAMSQISDMPYDQRFLKPLMKRVTDTNEGIRVRARYLLFCKYPCAGLTQVVGIKGYLCLLAVCFLVSFSSAGKKLITYYRNKCGDKVGRSKVSAAMAGLARAMCSLDGLVVLIGVVSAVIYKLYAGPLIEMAGQELSPEIWGYVEGFFPVLVLILAFDVGRIILKVAGRLGGVSSRGVLMPRTLVWLRGIVTMMFAAALIYCFNDTRRQYVVSGNFWKARQTYRMLADLQPPEAKDKLATIISQAQGAVRATDSRYLDQRQKEQAMETFVKLVSTRSRSKEEGRIREQLKGMMEELGAREIDCRKGDTNAPLNLVMEIPASEDLKNAPGILLNPHIDTVSACSPQWLEFDKEKGDFYHRYNGSIGADDKSGVTMVVEALRALKLNYWDRDYPHRRILAIFTAQEERGLLGAKYLAAHHREIFDELDICLSVDGYLEHGDRPYVHLVRKNRLNTFKAKQIGAIIEKFAKERHKPFRTYIASEGTSDADEFPPEAYKVAHVMTPSYGMHAKERVNARELIDYIDMLVNLVEQLDVNYLEAIGDRKGLDRLTETHLGP